MEMQNIIQMLTSMGNTAQNRNQTSKEPDYSNSTYPRNENNIFERPKPKETHQLTYYPFGFDTIEANTYFGQKHIEDPPKQQSNNNSNQATNNINKNNKGINPLMSMLLGSMGGNNPQMNMLINALSGGNTPDSIMNAINNSEGEQNPFNSLGGENMGGLANILSMFQNNNVNKKNNIINKINKKPNSPSVFDSYARVREYRNEK